MRFYTNTYKYCKWHPIGFSIGIGRTGIEQDEYSICLDLSLLFWNVEFTWVWFGKNPKEANYN